MTPKIEKYGHRLLVMGTAQLGKASPIWPRSCDAVMRWDVRRVHREAHGNSVMETLSQLGGLPDQRAVAARQQMLATVHSDRSQLTKTGRDPERLGERSRWQPPGSSWRRSCGSLLNPRQTRWSLPERSLWFVLITASGSVWARLGVFTCRW